nr:hypothetical protein HmN_000715100 [Hymenolepis microstoma]
MPKVLTSRFAIIVVFRFFRSEFSGILIKYSKIVISSLKDEPKPLSDVQGIPVIPPSDLIGHQDLSDSAAENHKRLGIGFRADNVSSFFHHSTKFTDSMPRYRTPGDFYPRK